MPFDRRDIRPGMDVYTHNNVYLGNILSIQPGLATGDNPIAEGARVKGHPLHGSTSSGELLGPMPTQPLGNRAPIVQSSHAGYAATADNARSLGQGHLTVGKWYGLLGKQIISLDRVQTVSLERVVLRRAT